MTHKKWVRKKLVANDQILVAGFFFKMFLLLICENIIQDIKWLKYTVYCYMENLTGIFFIGRVIEIRQLVDSAFI